MGMYEIPRNVKGERKNSDDIFYKSINNITICRKITKNFTYSFHLSLKPSLKDSSYYFIIYLYTIICNYVNKPIFIAKL